MKAQITMDQQKCIEVMNSINEENARFLAFKSSARFERSDMDWYYQIVYVKRKRPTQEELYYDATDQCRWEEKDYFNAVEMARQLTENKTKEKKNEKKEKKHTHTHTEDGRAVMDKNMFVLREVF